jgi:MinD-like ATPase involved in chromosome partitioning or flagellar assembly
MAIVAVAGDVCTTTTVALASAWPVADDVIVVEADPSGGDLAAWFDMPVAPSLSTVVTRVLDGAWPEIEQHTRLADSGVRVIPAPPRSGEAAQAVSEAARSVVTTLATLRSPVVIADTGRLQPAPAANPFVGSAAVTVLVHRQAAQSSRAAAVRLQRLADQLEAMATLPAAVVVAVVGAVPFGVDEIESFLNDAIGEQTVIGLPVDDLTAAVFGGRTGVSSRRLARLPLLKAGRGLAAATERALGVTADGLWRSGR